MAVPCGLILNETITNAPNAHGLQDGRAGPVAGGVAPDRAWTFRAEVSDDGGPAAGF